LYNFRFDSNRPPQIAVATIGYFKTGSPSTVVIQGPTPDSCSGSDTIEIESAVYTNGNHLLKIRAASSVKSTNRNAPTLRVYVTSSNELIGTLGGNPDGSYTGDFTWASNPQVVTVRSTLGGTSELPVVIGRDPR
jgi:hypothetical protein